MPSTAFVGHVYMSDNQATQLFTASNSTFGRRILGSGLHCTSICAGLGSRIFGCFHWNTFRWSFTWMQSHDRSWRISGSMPTDESNTGLNASIHINLLVTTFKILNGEGTVRNDAQSLCFGVARNRSPVVLNRCPRALSALLMRHSKRKARDTFPNILAGCLDIVTTYGVADTWRNSTTLDCFVRSDWIGILLECLLRCLTS